MPPLTSPGIVIVGGGQGGFQVAASLRAKKYLGPVTLFAEEPYRPYQRPPLSKGFVKDDVPQEALFFRPQRFFEDSGVDLRMETRVEAIDPALQTVTLSSGGDRLGYDRLVLATGARVRPLRVDGAGLDGIVYIRTLADALRLKALLPEAHRVVVIGGGFIGLEAAAVAAQLGKQVIVLEALDRLMARVVPPIISEFYRDLHEGHGVNVHLGVAVAACLGAGGRVTGVRLADGSEIAADLVIVGVGVIPNTELAEAAGLACDNGIVVDAQLRTTDPHIYAIGDCASFEHPMAAARIRLESVQNALDQAKAVAETLAGMAAPYAAMPWFWTDQFDTKLQMAGLSSGYDEIALRGDPGRRSFSVLYFADGRLVAVDSVNRPGDHMAARKLLVANTRLTPSQAADDALPLKSFL